MNAGLLRRRSATAVWIYVAVTFGILGMVIAARVLGRADFGVYATALVAVGFFQVLLDLTVEESLTKYGFRYVATEDWGRLRRLFRCATVVQALSEYSWCRRSTQGLGTEAGPHPDDGSGGRRFGSWRVVLRESVDDCLERALDLLAQRCDDGDDDGCDQSYHQPVLHCRRTALVSERVHLANHPAGETVEHLYTSFRAASGRPIRRSSEKTR